MEPLSIQLGIPAEKYWLLTFGEIMMQTEAYKRQQEQANKEKAMFDYNLAQLITYAFNKPEKMPKAEDVYSILKEEDENPQNLVPQKQLQATYNPEADQALFMQLAKGVKRFKETNENGGE